MKSLTIIFACLIVILASAGSACKKNKDLQLLQVFANAGSDRGIVLPTDSVILMGSAVSLGGSVVSYHWIKKSGPTQGVIISPNAASTKVTGLVAGTYEFELTVTDSNGKIASDIILITVYITDPCLGCWDY